MIVKVIQNLLLIKMLNDFLVKFIFKIILLHNHDQPLKIVYIKLPLYLKYF